MKKYLALTHEITHIELMKQNIYAFSVAGSKQTVLASSVQSSKAGDGIRTSSNGTNLTVEASNERLARKALLKLLKEEDCRGLEPVLIS